MKLSNWWNKLLFRLHNGSEKDSVLNNPLIQNQISSLKKLVKKTTGLDFDFSADNFAQYAKEIVEFYETILALMPEHVYWKDRNGFYLGCNNGVAKSAGLKDRKEIVGKTDWDMVWFKHAEAYRKIDEQAFRTGKEVIFEEPLTNVAGEKIIFLSNKVPLKNSHGMPIGILAVSTNITKLKEIEVSLRLAKEQAEAANQAKSDFLAMMTHELRTPLNVVLGMTQLMQSEGCSESQRQEYLKTISTSGKSLLGLINDILDFSKAQSGKLQIREE